MEDNEFRSLGRMVGEQIAAILISKPLPKEKAVELVIGVISVLEAHGIRATVPLLLSNDLVKRFMEKEQVEESTLRSAATLARKRWAEAKHEEIKVPRKRRSADTKSQTEVTHSETHSAEQSAETTQSTAEQAPNEETDSASPFVHDLPPEQY